MKLYYWFKCRKYSTTWTVTNNLFVSYVNGYTIRFSCPQTMTYRLFFSIYICLYKPKFRFPSYVWMFTEPFLKKILMTPIIYIQPVKIKLLTHHQCVCWFPHISMGSLNPFFLSMHCLLYWKPIAFHCLLTAKKRSQSSS